MEVWRALKKESMQGCGYFTIFKAAWKSFFFQAEDGITDEQLAENPALWDEYYEEADYEMRNSGYKIYSTIDPALHRAIQNRVTETQDQFGQTRTLTSTDDNGETVTTEFETQVGGTLTENTTGRVLAFVGNRS